MIRIGKNLSLSLAAPLMNRCSVKGNLLVKRTMNNFRIFTFSEDEFKKYLFSSNISLEEKNQVLSKIFQILETQEEIENLKESLSIQQAEKKVMLSALDSFVYDRKESSIHKRLSYTLGHANQLFESYQFDCKEYLFAPKSIICFVEENIIDLRSTQQPARDHPAGPPLVNPIVDVVSDVKSGSYENLTQQEKWQRFLTEEKEGHGIMSSLHNLKVPAPYKWFMTPKSVAEIISILSDKEVTSSEEFCARIHTDDGKEAEIDCIDEEEEHDHYESKRGKRMKRRIVSSALGFDGTDQNVCKFYDHLQIMMLTNFIVNHCFLSFEKPMN